MKREFQAMKEPAIVRAQTRHCTNSRKNFSTTLLVVLAVISVYFCLVMIEPFILLVYLRFLVVGLHIILVQLALLMVVISVVLVNLGLVFVGIFIPVDL